jgi:hypothetical protein
MPIFRGEVTSLCIWLFDGMALATAGAIFFLVKVWKCGIFATYSQSQTNKHTMTYTITNPELFTAQQVSVDICGDSVAVSYTRNSKIEYRESWGEHGPNDFAEFGFQICH